MLRLRLQPLQRVRPLPYRHLRGVGFCLKDIYHIFAYIFIYSQSLPVFFLVKEWTAVIEQIGLPANQNRLKLIRRRIDYLETDDAGVGLRRVGLQHRDCQL